MRAIKDTIIVKQEYQKESEKIIIPETARKFKLYDGNIKYIVVAVGPKYPYNLILGDKVHIRRHEGVKFLFKGVEYFKIKERWIEGKY